MRHFELCFSKRWSFMFPDTCLTWRRLGESYLSIWSQNLLHRVSPRLCASLRFQWFWVLRDTTQLCYKFHKSDSSFVFAFSSLVGMVALCGALLLVARQPCGAGIDTYPLLYSLFCLSELTLGRLTIVTRWSHTSICTVVEESCQGYFCLWHSFFSTHFDLVTRMARKVWRLSVSVGLFLSTGNIYPFLLQRHSIPIDSWPLSVFRFSVPGVIVS